jgi:NTP pyrophosphatase (non-canonical NTP hydrolase)
MPGPSTGKPPPEAPRPQPPACRAQCDAQPDPLNVRGMRPPQRPELEPRDQPTLVGLETVPASGRRARRSHVLDFRELAQWAREQVDWIAAKSRTDRRSDLFLFTQAAKLVEEVGELHAELLGIGGRQRDKGVVFDQSSLEGELADVAICVAILAQISGADLGQAIRTKMAAVDDRLAKQAEATG